MLNGADFLTLEYKIKRYGAVIRIKDLTSMKINSPYVFAFYSILSNNKTNCLQKIIPEINL